MFLNDEERVIREKTGAISPLTDKKHEKLQ
jgi:hypothetical protein